MTVDQRDPVEQPRRAVSGALQRFLERSSRRLVGQRRNEAQLRPLTNQPCHGLRKVRTESRHLALSAAWQHGDILALLGQRELITRGLGAQVHRYYVSKRMADEFGVHRM